MALATNTQLAEAVRASTSSQPSPYLCAAVELSSSAAFDRSERQGMLFRICMARLEMAEIRTGVAAMSFDVAAINSLMAAACAASELLLADPVPLPTRAIESDDDAVMAALQ